MRTTRTETKRRRGRPLAGRGSRPRPAEEVEGLTRRQQEILRLIAHGLTNRETAEALGISQRTVEVHRFNLMRRLRARNVAQLLRQAFQRGLLPNPLS